MIPGASRPAMTTRVKGTVHKARLKPFTAEELDSIYDSFETKRSIHKIMLGLIIYQGMELGDFSNIEIKDIDLSQGTGLYPIERTTQLKNSTTLLQANHPYPQLYPRTQTEQYNKTKQPDNLQLPSITRPLQTTIPTGQTPIQSQTKPRHPQTQPPPSIPDSPLD